MCSLLNGYLCYIQSCCEVPTRVAETSVDHVSIWEIVICVLCKHLKPEIFRQLHPQLVEVAVQVSLNCLHWQGYIHRCDSNCYLVVEEEVMLLMFLRDAHLQLEKQFLILKSCKRLDLLLNHPGRLSDPHASLVADVARALLHRPVNSTLQSGELRQLGRIMVKRKTQQEKLLSTLTLRSS